MEMNKPTLVATIVLVFVVGLVFGSFSGLGNVATGEATRTGTSTCNVYVDKRAATTGETITVTTTKNCMTPFSLYGTGSRGQIGTRIRDYQDLPCDGIRCQQQEVFDLRVGGDWPKGINKLCSKDGTTSQLKCATIEVY